ncbi:MAG: hypothetical protein HZA83_02515 [Thaumarchaeota archaeon]|nr:hypothetical protein [Nitrososphaerota archaeon]
MRYAPVFLSLLFLSAIVLADIGPGPKDRPGISLAIDYENTPVANGTSVEVLCYYENETISTVYGSPIPCSNGKCEDLFYYYLSQCSSGNVAFNITGSSLSQTYSTERVNISRNSRSYFTIDLYSNGTSIVKPADEPQQPCIFFIALILLLFAGQFCKHHIK